MNGELETCAAAFFRIKGKDVVAVLDIDSRELATFDGRDATGLEAIAALLANLF